MTIPTTHTGSLARPPELRDMLAQLAKGEPVDMPHFEDLCTAAVQEVVDRQCAIGLDIVNDGEQAKIGFAQYVRLRMTGFENSAPIRRQPSLEEREFPEAAGQVKMQLPVSSALGWKDFVDLERDICNLKAAMARHPGKTAFMTAVSPGTFANNNPDRFYNDRGRFMDAIVDLMRHEYHAIINAGFDLQLDCPDLAQKSYNFPDMSFADWRGVVADNIAALNAATEGLPRERIRTHVCWGAGEDPHTHDTELHTIADLLMTLNVGAVSFVCANGRHAHEWRAWQDIALPEGMRVVMGVIDNTTNIVEHPGAVEERLLNLASVIPSDRIIAGVDCGFGTTGIKGPVVHPSVVWAKLAALVEGTRRANQHLRQPTHHGELV